MRVLVALLMAAAALPAGAAPAVAAPVVLHDCETLAGWPGEVKLSETAHDGARSVMLAPPPGKLTSVVLNFAPTKVDLRPEDELSFWYRIEGEGLRSFMLKVVAHPIGGGMQATYPVAGGDVPTGKWHQFTADLGNPTYLWGEKPDLKSRALHFRLETAPGSTARLLVDQITVTRRIFAAEVGQPRVDRPEGQVVFRCPVTLRSLAAEPLRLVAAAQGREWLATVSPGETSRLEVTLKPSGVWMKSKKPLDSTRETLTVRVAGEPGTQRELSVALVKPLDLPPHPRLLLTRDGVKELRRKIRDLEWARKAYDGLKKSADGWLERPIELPDRGGQWWHWYSCKKHGARLKTKSPTEHVCPVDGEVYTGYPYDDVVLSSRHSALADAVLRLGIVYQVAGERKYAEKAREILLAYAEKYLSYPLHNIQGKVAVGGGRVGPQTLDEAVWLIPMAQGADLVWDALSEVDIRTLKEKLFYPAAVDVIRAHKMGIHNIQCWKNSAVGLTGLLFDDAELVADAVTSKHGYQAQMAEGVQKDGPWYEGAWGYHFYTLMAVTNLTEAMHHCGLEPYGPELKGMFDAPVDFAMPNLRLPAFNDSGEADVKGQHWLYEIAYTRYHDPKYLAVLAGSPRTSLQALVCGVDEIPASQARAQESRNYPVSGYAILTSGAGADATWLCLDYGPHGGGHGHPDKLGFVLYARGGVVAPDPGTAAYGVPIQREWFRQTISHNTITVDEQSQRETTGSCPAFAHTPEISAATCDAGGAYEGVRIQRTAALFGSDVLLFLDCLASDNEHTYDLAFHAYGQLKPLPDAAAWTPPAKPGYMHFQGAECIARPGTIEVAIEAKDRPACRAAFLNPEGGQVIAGTGVGRSTADRVPMVLARRKARNAEFAWAIRPGDGAGEPDLAIVPVAGSGEARCARLRLGAEEYLVLTNPAGAKVRFAGWETASKLACVHQAGERVDTLGEVKRVE